MTMVVVMAMLVESNKEGSREVGVLNMVFVFLVK